MTEIQELREVNYMVFKKLVNTLMNKKIKKYQISGKKADEPYSQFKIAVDGNYCHINIYFDKKIKISVGMYTLAHQGERAYYELFNGKDIPKNKDEYVDIVFGFLKEMITWGPTLEYVTEGYKRGTPSCYKEADFPFRASSYEDMFLHEYSWERKEEMQYITNVWKSKEYRNDRKYEQDKY